MHFDRIILTTDFSEASYRAFDIAAYDQKMEGTEICLLYVYQYFQPPISFEDLPTPLIGAEYYEENRIALLARLEEIGAKFLHGQKIKAEVVMSLNPPADTICEFAKKQKAELIIIGSRGHSVLQGLFLGSTVQRVLLKAPCPVMVVPSCSDESATPC